MKNFSEIFSDVTSENFQEKILAAKEIWEQEMDNAKLSNAEMKKKDEEIAHLRDTNQRLFLRIGNDLDTSEAEESQALSMNDIINNIKNMED